MSLGRHVINLHSNPSVQQDPKWKVHNCRYLRFLGGLVNLGSYLGTYSGRYSLEVCHADLSVRPEVHT